MTVTVNGASRTVPDGTTLAVLLASVLDRPGRRGTAAAVNGQVVPRAEHAGRRLAEGDVVEVVTAVQGG